MYEFDFLKRNRERILVYKEIPLPVILCGRDLSVHWSNDLARIHYPHLAQAQGVRLALMEFDLPALLREAVENGSCTIREVIPLSNVNIKIIPILEGGALSGAALVLTRDDCLLDTRSVYHTTRASGALSDSIREVVSEMFSIIDLTTAKSEPAKLDWVQSGLSDLALNGYRILRVAANITEYARYQSELLNFRPELVSLTAFLRQAQETITQLAGAAGVPLRLNIPEGDFFVQLDLERFEHAFFNILHNALYYTKPGNRLLISLRAGKKKDTATIGVADRGLGIPREILPQVDRPYYGYAHNKGTGRSVGLGLAIAKLAAQTHEGRLSIRSKEGEGTTVQITLPMGTKAGQSIPLAQGGPIFGFQFRFGIARVGLADLPLSPHCNK